jgi:DNA-binding response OmpR family regulator
MARILLIDDDQHLRQVLRYYLVQAGHEVIEARNGNEALTQTCAFDLAITDIVMPDRDGFETISALRARQPDLKIIAMSGGGIMSATSYLALARQLGAGAVLAKPFSMDEFAATLESVLRD